MFHESLESRRLMAATFTIAADVLTIAGGDGADDIVVATDTSDGTLVVKDGGVVKKTYAEGTFTRIEVDGRGGNDKLRSEGVPSWTSVKLRGGSGHDILRDTAGYAVLDGGSGSDQMYGLLQTVADYSGRTNSVTVNFNTTNGDGEAGENDHVDQTVGTVRGGSGNDTIIGHLVGIDAVIGAENNFFGGPGDDTLVGNAGFDLLDGQTGNDTLRTGPGQGYMFGGDGDDVLEGGDGPNELTGGNGNDRLRGGPSTDLLVGGDGADDIQGGGGNEDVVDYSASPAGVTVTLDNVANDGRSTPGFWLPGPFGSGRWFPGTSEADNVHDDVEHVVGSDYNDAITGSDGDEILEGGTGNDRLFGLGGADRLLGGFGHDTIDGGAGHDELVGGDGNDTLYARDGFYFESVYGNNADGTGTGYDRAQVDRVTMYLYGGSFPLIAESTRDIDELF